MAPFSGIFLPLFPHLKSACAIPQKLAKVSAQSSLYPQSMGTPPLNTEPTSSFAGALAAFASGHGDNLADDIAVLSYEGSVRTQAGIDPAPAAQPEPATKSASVTIRMSDAECAQLRKRAAAANLTLSAYMRSCILEAETLRLQVREALAELRAATPDAPQPAAISQPCRQPSRHWWQRSGRSN